MRIHTIMLVTVSLLAMTNSAFAYLDPGTGSVVTTAILGFFAAIAYTARKYIYKIKDLFTGSPKGKEAAKRDR